MAQLFKHLLIYLIVIIIIGVCSLVFPHPSNKFLLAILLVSICVILVLMFNPYQASQISKKVNKAIRSHRLFINLIFNSLMIFCILAFVLYIVSNIHKNTNPSNPIPNDDWYILALLIFWFVCVKEIVFLERKWELSAIAATCIPFMQQDHKIKTIMIYNTNFHQWMFPGGHVKIDGGEFPEEVAIRKAASEAGIEVKLMSTFDIISEYSHCKPKKSPLFVYHLFIEEEARCRKYYGHEYHIDFTYIGEFDKVKGGGIFDTILIDIEPRCNDVSTIRQCIHQSLLSKYRNENKPIPKSFYPEDIPDRLLVAFDAYKSTKGL